MSLGDFTPVSALLAFSSKSPLDPDPGGSPEENPEFLRACAPEEAVSLSSFDPDLCRVGVEKARRGVDEVISGFDPGVKESPLPCSGVVDAVCASAAGGVVAKYDEDSPGSEICDSLSRFGMDQNCGSQMLVLRMLELVLIVPNVRFLSELRVFSVDPDSEPGPELLP